MAPVEVYIRGSSDLHKFPERGILRVEIEAKGPSKTAVSEKVLATSQKVREGLDALSADSAGTGAAVTHYSITSLTTTSHEREERNKDRELIRQWTEFTTTVTCEAIFKDFAKFNEVATELSTTEHLTITETEWILLAETLQDMVAESVQAAYANALHKAKAYAKALGLQHVKAVRIRDNGEEASSGFQAHGRTRQTARRSTGHYNTYDSQGITFAPRDVTVSGSCNVDFEFE